MQNLPKLSVVVATYARAETLRETLRHLAEQELARDEYEVIVVDDGSSDHTGLVVEEAIAEGRLQLRYLRHENQGPGFTQNQGIRAARAPLVLLMADDVFMTPTALSAHLARHAAHPEPEVAVLGNLVQSPRLDQTAFLRNWDPFRFCSLPDGRELPASFFWAANISFKREFMLRHGMFRDERGRGGAAAHEDVELGYRLHRHGLRIVHDKAALAHHHHIETLEDTIQRAHERGLNWQGFRDLVPEAEIPLRYRVLNSDTIMDHIRAITGPQRTQLMGPERSLVAMSIIYLGRAALFNRLTVPHLWLPLMQQAERSPRIERWMRTSFYRGVVSYHFTRAISMAKQLYAEGGRPRQARVPPS